MKYDDFLGNEIKIGDKIIVCNNGVEPNFISGVIRKFYYCWGEDGSRVEFVTEEADIIGLAKLNQVVKIP